MTTEVKKSGGLAILTAWWRRAKRRPARFFRSYLDLCILTQQNSDTVADFEPMNHLSDCAGVWKGEKGGPKRPVGCGDRCKCPLCADYYHSTQAREGIALVSPVFEACDAAGVSRDSWGDRIELTLPKAVSASLDALSEVDTRAYRDKVNKLRQAAWRCVGRAVSRACADKGLPAPGRLGGVMVLHHWGSSAPWIPHYHFHVYLLPYTAEVQGPGDGGAASRELANWRALPLWWPLLVDGREYGSMKEACEAKGLHLGDKGHNCRDSLMGAGHDLAGGLETLRASWKKAAQRVLGEHYSGDWNVHRSYCERRREFLHFVAYQLRAPLRDLWKGLRGDAQCGFEYHAMGKPGQPAIVKAILPADFDAAVSRSRFVSAELQRVTWYGLLSNICQTNTLRGLGLIRSEDCFEDDADVSGESVKYWRPVDTTALGVLFKSTDGSEEVDFVAWDTLLPHPVAGPCDKPIGAKRRHRWFLPPGEV